MQYIKPYLYWMYIWDLYIRQDITTLQAARQSRRNLNHEGIKKPYIRDNKITEYEEQLIKSERIDVKVTKILISYFIIFLPTQGALNRIIFTTNKLANYVKKIVLSTYCQLIN